METLLQEAEEDAPRGCASGAATSSSRVQTGSCTRNWRGTARAAALRVLLQDQRTFGEGTGSSPRLR